MKRAFLWVTSPLLEGGCFQLPPGFSCTHAEYDEEQRAVRLTVAGPFPDEVVDGGEVGMLGTSFPHRLFFLWQWSVDRRPVGVPVVMFYSGCRSGC